MVKENIDYGGREYVSKFMDTIGLGTYEIRSETTIHKIVDAALDAGYRFIDTAQVYRNEQHIGRALTDLLPKYGLQRKDIFITSKLGPANQGAEKCRQTVEVSLEKLQTDYVDLYLIHWPGTSRLNPNDERNRELRMESWRTLEKLYREGKLRSIGVSNYNVSHLEELLERCDVWPAVNQCEYHPHYYQSELVEFCQTKNVHFQAYSSFGSASNKNALFDDEKIKEMAAKYSTSVTNFLLAWTLCQGISVLPRSRNTDHVRANFTAKSLKVSDQDIEAVKLVDVKKYCWDPAPVC